MTYDEKCYIVDTARQLVYNAYLNNSGQPCDPFPERFWQSCDRLVKVIEETIEAEEEVW